MPELPEVETIARSLRDGGRGYLAINGKTIRSAKILWHRTLAEPDLTEFYRRIVGQKINDISRRGKFLYFSLPDWKLVFHLRMSGDFRVHPNCGEDVQAELHPHDRAYFTFDDGTCLFFNDTRKFGRIWLVPDVGRLFSNLGPEPFDELLTDELFYRRLQKKNRQIKTLLLDQSFLAGTGNIYADEALHRAKIHPCQAAGSLSYDDASRLLQALRDVFTRGIERQGASIDWVYRGGGFQDEFRVYQRTNLPCYSCGAQIERIVVGQRGTHFCPDCQRLK